MCDDPPGDDDLDDGYADGYEAATARAKPLLDVVRILLREVSPFSSAWEMVGQADGEELWDQMRKAAVALDPTIDVD